MTKQGKKAYNIKKNWKADTGRPTKCTPDVVTKLVEIFENDGSVEDACYTVGVAPKNFYERMKTDKDFRKRIDMARRAAFILAQKTLMKSMNSEKEDIALKAAVEFSKRRDPRYRDKAELEADVDLDGDVDVKLKDKSMIDLEELRKGLLGF